MEKLTEKSKKSNKEIQIELRLDNGVDEFRKGLGLILDIVLKDLMEVREVESVAH